MASEKNSQKSQSSSHTSFLLVFGLGLLTVLVNYSPISIQELRILVPQYFGYGEELRTADACHLISQQTSNATEVHWPGT